MLFGHLALAVLEHRYLKADLAPVIMGGIFPDLIDKTLCHVIGITPNGRTIAHTLLGLGLSTLLLGLVRGRRTAWSWGLGYLGHLLGDFNGPVPWLYPFVKYDFPPSLGLAESISRLMSNPAKATPDVLLSAWAIGATRKQIAEAMRKGAGDTQSGELLET
ncbi:MAG: metal-dependent hydrolase [Thermoflexales bacterium]|nr:metal-dependent hydrolase [Thermoflexales bacterium]